MGPPLKMKNPKPLDLGDLSKYKQPPKKNEKFQTADMWKGRQEGKPRPPGRKSDNSGLKDWVQENKKKGPNKKNYDPDADEPAQPKKKKQKTEGNNFNPEKLVRAGINEFAGEHKGKAHQAVSVVNAGVGAAKSSKVKAAVESVKSAFKNKKFDFATASDLWHKGSAALKDKNVQKLMHGAKNFFDSFDTKKNKKRKR
jgi:hypothetical protein